MTRRAFVDRDRKMVCFWSPKAGNTSLAEWLVRGLREEEYEASGDGRPPRGYLKSVRGVVDFRRAQRLVEDRRFDSFALVRDPYARAAAVYFNKFLYNGRRRLDELSELEGFARAFLVQSNGTDAPYRGPSFIEFLETVRVRVKERSRDGEPDLDGHWNTQVPFAFLDAGFSYG